VLLSMVTMRIEFFFGVVAFREDADRSGAVVKVHCCNIKLIIFNVHV
jgi:hypothetical protein